MWGKETIYRRLTVSLAACAIGWLAGNSMIVLLAVVLAPQLELGFWLLASAALCFLGWLLVGVPLSLKARSFEAGRPRMLAVLAAGLAGLVMILVISSPWIAEGAPEAWTFVGVAGGQAMATGGISMLVYCLLVDRLERRG